MVSVWLVHQSATLERLTILARSAAGFTPNQATAANRIVRPRLHQARVNAGLVAERQQREAANVREAQAIDVRACHRTLRWFGEAIDKVLDEMRAALPGSKRPGSFNPAASNSRLAIQSSPSAQVSTVPCSALLAMPPRLAK